MALTTVQGELLESGSALDNIGAGNITPSYLSTQSQYTGFKNRLINGNISVWQRGTSGFTTIGNYSADRWIIAANNSISTGAQSSDVPTGFPYSISVSGTGYAQVKQRIESVNCTDLASQTVTISFWLKQTSGAGANSIFLQLFYANSANSFGSTTQIGSNAYFTGTSGWVQYSTTFTTISANAVNGLELVIGGNTGSSSAFLITGIQLEKGSTATSFDYRPYGTELNLCQRYCYAIRAAEASGAYSTFAQTAAYTSTALSGNFIPKVTMRVVPTLSTTGTASNYMAFNGTFFTLNSVPVITTDSTPSSFTVDSTVGSGLTAGLSYRLVANNNNTAFLIFSAEL